MTPNILMTQAEIDVDRPRWHKLRRTGVTASEIAAIMGIAPPEHGSAWAVYAAKMTGEEFQGDTDATLRGTHLEGYVADRYATEEDRHLMMGGLFNSTERPWQMATLDRIIQKEGASERGWWPAQIKTSATYEGWGEPGTDEIPVQYRAQCLWEMDVYEADEVIVPCLFVHDWKLRNYRVVRNRDAQADILCMRAAGEEFMERLAVNDPPEVDWRPATTKALKTLHSGEPVGTAVIPVHLARRYSKARRSKSLADRRLAQATNEILALAGDARYIVTGPQAHPRDRDQKVATRTRSPRRSTDAELLRKKYPAIAKEVERSTDVTVLYPGSWAKGKDERTIR